MVREGLLAIETHPDHPGLVLIREVNTPPEGDLSTESDGSEYWCIYRYRDVEAATMHAHQALRRQFVSTGLYRTDVVNAVAALDAIQLVHETVWSNPSLSPAELDAINRNRQQRNQRHRHNDRIMQLVGRIGLVMLGLMLFAPLVNKVYRVLFG